EVPRRGIDEQRIGELAGRFLPGRGLQGRQAVVGGSGPRVPRARAALVHEVVISRGAGGGRVVDDDVPDPAVARIGVVRLAGARIDRNRGRVDDGSGRVVHRHVVLDVVVAARALDVDAVRAVEVDRVADDAAAGHIEVVDAVVAVVVGDVVRHERVVATGVDVNSGVLIGVCHIADDGVARGDVVDAVGIALELVRIVVRGVPRHRHAGRGAGQLDAVGRVVVRDVSLHEPAVEIAQVDA